MKRAIVTVLAVVALVGLTRWSEAAASKSMVGQKLPELKVKYLGDAPDLTGKPLVVEFWATWCPPCRASIPHMNKIYAEYKEKGLEIIGVSNESVSKIKSFLKKIPIEYNVARDSSSKLMKEFGITGIPHAVIVNKEGTIVWEGHPMALPKGELDKVLQ